MEILTDHQKALVCDAILSAYGAHANIATMAEKCGHEGIWAENRTKMRQLQSIYELLRDCRTVTLEK